MNKIVELVLTGGPCAGKTSGLSKIDEKVAEKGWKVIIVPETATEVITSGIAPPEVPTEDFQKVIIQRGINKEKTVREVAHVFNKPVLILYDRGIPDSKAYMEHDSYLKILEDNNLSEIQVRDAYDAVFHLVTAAIGAEKHYTKANNKARRESLEEAIIADKKTQMAWVGHPHMRVIDNSTGFNEKIDRLLKEVFAAMGIPVPTEIERKFLIEKPTLEQLEAHECVKSQIVQTYLTRINPDIERRVRQRGIDGDYSYYYTEKKSITGMSRDELERKITKDEYLKYLTEGVHTIRKTRYCFFYKNQYFELDVYPGWINEAILEIELTQENQQIILPDWITVKKEVTGDEQYSNFSLAK